MSIIFKCVLQARVPNQLFFHVKPSTLFLNFAKKGLVFFFFEVNLSNKKV